MIIERYSPECHAACMQIFESNCPPYFAPEEKDLLQRWLHGLDEGINPYEASSGNYFYIARENEQVVGCAGFYIAKGERRAHLVWGMIDRDRHKKGYGGQLFGFRMNKIRRIFPEHEIILDTSQHTFRFFEKMGFRVTKITPDGYGRGLDRYDMA